MAVEPVFATNGLVENEGVFGESAAPERSIRYPIIGKPPVLLGAFQVKVTEPSPGVAVSCVGAPAFAVKNTLTELLAPLPIVVIGVTRIQIC